VKRIASKRIMLQFWQKPTPRRERSSYFLSPNPIPRFQSLVGSQGSLGNARWARESASMQMLQDVQHFSHPAFTGSDIPSHPMTIYPARRSFILPDEGFLEYASILAWRDVMSNIMKKRRAILWVVQKMDLGIGA